MLRGVIESRKTVNVIKYNGQEYAKPRDLPPNVRRAYELALHGERGANARRILRRFRGTNDRDLDLADTVPSDVCRLCDKILSVINNNGEVTLPGFSDKVHARCRRQVYACATCFGAACLLALILFLRFR